MRLRMSAAVCTTLLLPLLAFAGQNANDFVVHGTINIALGNENGIVVLTDSMLTSGGHQLSQPGLKIPSRSLVGAARLRLAVGSGRGWFVSIKSER
ncbi:MAG: hypothetical protein WBQ89_24585 [Candidatus Acidiferrum sp.]